MIKNFTGIEECLYKEPNLQNWLIFIVLIFFVMALFIKNIPEDEDYL